MGKGKPEKKAEAKPSKIDTKNTKKEKSVEKVKEVVKAVEKVEKSKKQPQAAIKEDKKESKKSVEKTVEKPAKVAEKVEPKTNGVDKSKKEKPTKKEQEVKVTETVVEKSNKNGKKDDKKKSKAESKAVVDVPKKEGVKKVETKPVVEAPKKDDKKKQDKKVESKAEAPKEVKAQVNGKKAPEKTEKVDSKPVEKKDVKKDNKKPSPKKDTKPQDKKRKNFEGASVPPTKKAKEFAGSDKVFIVNIPKKLSEDNFRSALASFGPVKKIAAQGSTAVVTFHTVEGAQAAIKAGKKVIGDDTLKIEEFVDSENGDAKKEEKPSKLLSAEMNGIVVTNLPRDFSADGTKKFMLEFGTIKSFYHDAAHGKAYVTYTTPLPKNVLEYNGATVGGQKISIRIMTELDKQVRVTPIASDLDKQGVQDYFAEIGEIESISLVPNPMKKTEGQKLAPSQTATITFKDYLSVEKSFEYNGAEIHGLSVRIERKTK